MTTKPSLPRSPAGSIITPTPTPLDRRQIWAATRFWMETENVKSRRYGGKSHHHWGALRAATRAFALALKVCGWYDRGERNARDLRLRTVTHSLPRVPRELDGLTILQLSDLHVDGMPGLERTIIERLAGQEVDLCVLTGDFRQEVHGPIHPSIEGLRHLVDNIDSRLGFVGILGNHDSCHMVEPMERLGIRMLINETMTIECSGRELAIIGVDDPHWFYTEQAVLALEDARHHELTVALVHSPELYDVAAEQGVDLYLCGHTHGGQVCLPGGHAIVKHLSRGRNYYRDLWQHGAMRGFTHAGVGTSSIPIRFNTRGELVIHRLEAGA